MPESLHIWYLASGRRTPSSRYRVFPFARHLQQRGHHCTVSNSFPEKYDHFRMLGWTNSRRLKRLVRRWHLWQIARSQPDVVVLERELFDEPTWEFEQQLRQNVKCLILDIDDAVFLRYPDKFTALARMCDGLIVGNDRLKEHFAPMNQRIVVIPTCVDAEQYPPRPDTDPNRSPIRIGWIGTPVNLTELQLVAPALRELSSKSAIELCLISSRPPLADEIDLAGIQVQFVPWSEKQAVASLHQCDIGLMPLRSDQPWNHYKCGLKLIEYMAVGLPAVASPVGVNTQIVTDEVNGLLAEGTGDWTRQLARLIADAELRRRLGTAARETVRERYSIQSQLPLYEQTLRDWSASR